VIRETTRLILAEPRKSESSEGAPTDVGELYEDGQSPIPCVPSNKGKTEDRPGMGIPLLGEHVDHERHGCVELWV